MQESCAHGLMLFRGRMFDVLGLVRIRFACHSRAHVLGYHAQCCHLQRGENKHTHSLVPPSLIDLYTHPMHYATASCATLMTLLC